MSNPLMQGDRYGHDLVLRTARPDEYELIGEITVAVYVDEGFVAVGSPYVASLRDAASRAEKAELLVAESDGTVIGTVTYCRGASAYSNIGGPADAEFRMLAVVAAARGNGVAKALVRLCIDKARAAGCTALRLSTQPDMRAAHHLYRRLGFVRTPELDWQAVPGATLLTYAFFVDDTYCDRCGSPLGDGRHETCRTARRMEPPRYCPKCRRRLVVQVTPHGWSARCSRHGVTDSAVP